MLLFSFLLDFATKAYWNLTHSTPKDVKKYSVKLAHCLAVSCKVAELLLVHHAHHALHRELFNSRQPYPHHYKFGDYVFARHAVCSNAGKECIDKLTYSSTGPGCVNVSHAVTHEAALGCPMQESIFAAAAAAAAC